MRWGLAISLLGLVGCTSTVAPLVDDCPCPNGLVCCPGTSICVGPGSGSGCPDPSAVPPDLATVDMATPPDLTPGPDMLKIPRFDFDPPAPTFAKAIANHDQTTLMVHVLNRDHARIDSLQLATNGTGGDQLAIVSTFSCNAATTDCDVQIRFTPNRPGPVSSTLTITSGSITISGCTIKGSAEAGVPVLTVDATVLDFGDVHTKAFSAPLPLTVHNEGTAPTSNLVTNFDPLAAPFVFDSTFHNDACGTTLGAGSSCRLYLIFGASQEGPVSAKLTVADGKVTSPAVTLEGRGINPAALSVSASGPFPFEWVGNHSDDITFHVSNGGGDPSGRLATSITDSGSNGRLDFNITSDGCTGQTLDAGAACDIKVQFAPHAHGGSFALLNVTATPGGNVATAMSGRALVPATFKLEIGSGTITVDTPPLAHLGFGLRNVGDAAAGPLQVSLAGTPPKDVFILETVGSCLSGPVTAGELCMFEILFLPPFQGRWQDTATVTWDSHGLPATPVVIPLDGTYSSTATLRANPAAMNFGSVSHAGWNRLTIKNTLPQPIGPLKLAVSGDSNFSIFDGSGCDGQTLAAGNTCEIKVQYTPTFTGRFTGTLTVSADAGSVSVPLSASSTLPAFKFDPVKADFGTVGIGAVVPPITITVTNVSNRPAPTAFTVSDTNFWVTSNCPATLQPAPATNSCTIGVGFGPRAGGTYQGNVTFTGADARPTVPLVGIAQ